MDVQEMLHNLNDVVSAAATVKKIYGDPIVAGDRTVVPIAQVKYAFGGGAGKRGEGAQSGGGAGARVSMTPCGALEISPQGTRFVPFEDHRRTLGALAIGFALGALLAAAASTRRDE